MRKNVIHNFDLSIKNSADIKSSEDLTKVIIKELAKVSQEMNQQKDIVQIWQEQKSQNAAIANNSSFSTGGGAIDTSTKTSEKPLSIGNTSSVSGETINNVALSGATSTTNALIGEGVADITGRKTINSTASNNITSPTSGAGNTTLNFNNGITQTYANVAAQQTLTVPQVLQTNNSEPTIEAIKTEIKKKLDAATDMETIQYWRNIAKAFNEGATAQDFDGKPNNMLFTQMYAILKQSNTAIENQNFNWEIIREKMIKSINTNILSGIISDESKKRWTIIQQQLKDDKVNITNLFEQYGELFLLLKEVEGLNALPSTITIATKTKIYPNLSALYPAIGKEDVYVFLKGISDIRGSAVDKGAVKIKNTVATSFIVGESLEFTLDETFIKQSQFQKENINWIVYHVGNKQESIFRDKGTSLTYNFDKAGTYRIDAYGNKHTVKGNKKALGSTFIELKIEAQQIIITSPGITKDGQTRTSTKEKLFKVDLKYPKVKTLNPLKLYYQVETKTGNKVTIVSEEQELDSTGIIKFPIPNLGEYCIKLTSKDQYALNKEYKINAIKNEVTSIGQVGKASNIGHFLVGVSNNTLTLETKTFKINPATDEEKEDVKWIIYDSNNKPYLPPGSVVLSDDNNPKKTYLHKWSYFDVPLPKKEGHYTVEAYNDTRQGTKAKSVFSIEMMRAQITEAYWASGGGSKKRMSGFEGESNWIKANIPYYNNQTVRIYFYLNTIKTKYYLDTKTNERGEIFQEIKFDSDFQKQIGFQGSKNAKIGFKVLGIQNGKPYPFKAPTNYESDTVLAVTTDIKILDAYFIYDGSRVTSQDKIPFDKKGTTLTIVAKTQNMIGKEIVLTAHKVGEKPAFRHKVIVNSEGVAITKFDIIPAKGAKNGTVNKYYVGIEGCSTKHLTDKMINMVVGDTIKDAKLNSGALEIIWGGKVSVEFRQKVVRICKDLWGEDQKFEMANALMIAMSVETWETFSSSVINSKGIAFSKEAHKNNPNLVNEKAVGLAQFTIDAVKSLILKERGILENAQTANAITKQEVNDYKQKLALLSPEDQLDYVKTYLMLFNNYKKVVRPEDVYMIIFAPRATGKGDHVDIYKKYKTIEDKIHDRVNIKYRDNASMDIKNDGFNKGNNDSIIQSGELLARYREMKNKGLRYAIEINEARKLNQVLAEKILKGGRVTFANSHVSNIIDEAMAQDNITDTSLGKNAKRSNYGNAPGGEIEIISEILYILYDLSKIYKLNISEIVGASHSSERSFHYKGVAIDINEIDGTHIGRRNNPGFSLDFHKKIRKIAIDLGATKVLDPYNEPVYHYNHIHIEIAK